MPHLRDRHVQDLRKEIRTAAIEPRKLALRIAGAALSKKADDVVVLDMRAVCGFCDFFVIASGSSQRQVNAIADAVQEDLGSAGIKTLSPVNPNDASGWSVVDYGSVIVHVFFKPMREFYSLEHLWQGAKHVRVSKK